MQHVISSIKSQSSCTFFNQVVMHSPQMLLGLSCCTQGINGSLKVLQTFSNRDQKLPSKVPEVITWSYRVSKNDLYHIWEKYQKYKINTVCNDDTYTVLVMISTLCFDYIIMMSRFVELLHDIIENQWNPCFDFLCRDKINGHEVSGTASQWQELLGASMFNEQRQCLCCVWLLWGQQASLCLSDSNMLIKLFHITLFLS